MDSAQGRFIDFIVKRKSKEKLLYAMIEELNIRKGAAYKRMNGDTKMSFEEIDKISARFGVSIDTAIGSAQFISMEHPFIKHDNSIDFLDKYAYYLKPLIGAQGDSKLVYMANELPIFYYFSHRYIFNFLLSVWNHLHWGEGRLKIVKNADISPQLNFLGSEVSNYYESHPVTEIWNSNMLSNLYQQIQFAVTIRAFEDAFYIEQLIADIKNLIERLQKIAGSGERQDEKHANTKIYLNEFGNYQNLAIYQSQKLTVTFIGFDMPHFVVSYNKDFCDYSFQWIEKIKKRSVLISSEGYQFRELFFMKMQDDFKAFHDKLDKLKSVYY